MPREVLGDPWGSLGSSLGVPGYIPGGTKNEVVHGECPGTILGGPMGVFGGIGRSLVQS